LHAILTKYTCVNIITMIVSDPSIFSTSMFCEMYVVTAKFISSMTKYTTTDLHVKNHQITNALFRVVLFSFIFSDYYYSIQYMQEYNIHYRLRNDIGGVSG